MLHMPTRSAARAFMIAGVVAVALLLTSASAAGAATAPTSVTPDHVTSGGTVSMTGGGFKPTTTVDAVLDLASVATGTADADGNVTISFTATSFEGIHRVRLIGIDTAEKAHVLSGVVSILSSASANATAGLPQTGADSRTLAGLGVLVIAGGAVLVWRGNKRPHTLRPASRAGGLRPASRAGGLAAVAAIGAMVVAGLATGPKVAHAQATGTGTIVGKVQRGTTPLEKICVHVSSGQTWGGADLTDANGDYSIGSLPAGNWVVGFADCTGVPTHITEYANNKFFYGTADQQAVSDGVTTTVNADLGQGAVIIGRVTDATSGAGIKDACARMGTTAEDTGCLAFSVTTGAYATLQIPGGDYIVGFSPNDATHAVKYYKDKNDPATATKVVAPAGLYKLEIDQALPAAAKISGVVIDDASNAAPSNKCIRIEDFSSDAPTMVSAFPGTDGSFTLTGLPAGTHKVKFSECGNPQGGYVQQFFDSKATVAAADPVPLAAGENRNGVNARMSTTGIPPSGSPTTVPPTTAPPATTTPTTAPAGGTTTTTAAVPAANGPATASTSTPAVGGSMSLSGGGFRPGSTVNGFIYSTPTHVASGTASATGKVTLTFRLPASITPGAHTAELHGIDLAGQPRVLSTPITVRSQLPATGAGRCAPGLGRRHLRVRCPPGDRGAEAPRPRTVRPPVLAT